MRIAYLAELVVVLAVGLAAARWQLGDVNGASNGVTTPARPGPLWFGHAADGFLAGAALVGLIGLTIEVARGRSPRPWGSGRWAWSFLGLYLVLYPAVGVAIDAAERAWWFAVPWGSIVANIPDMFRYCIGSRSTNSRFMMLVALMIARRMAAPGPVATDAREWAGRAFAALIIVIGFGRYLIEGGKF